jgi:hypothetical protein
MLKEQAGVNDVERGLVEGIRADVVHADLDVRTLAAGQLADVDVRDEHPARWPYAVSHEAGDRATTTAELQAPHPGSDADRVQVPKSAGVEELLRGRETTLLIRPDVAQPEPVRRTAHAHPHPRSCAHGDRGELSRQATEDEAVLT